MACHPRQQNPGFAAAEGVYEEKRFTLFLAFSD